MENEVWRDVVGFESVYMVSNLGRVKSLDRVIMRKNGVCENRRGKMRRPIMLKKGYFAIDLCGKTVKIHCLVARAFIGPRPAGTVIDHIDRNKINNKVSNLRYISLSTNVRNSAYYEQRSSRYAGVSFCKDRNKWSAGITHNHKKIKLGRFSSEIDAARAYDAYVIKHNLDRGLNNVG